MEADNLPVLVRDGLQEGRTATTASVLGEASTIYDGQGDAETNAPDTTPTEIKAWSESTTRIHSIGSPNFCCDSFLLVQLALILQTRLMLLWA